MIEQTSKKENHLSLGVTLLFAIVILSLLVYFFYLPDSAFTSSGKAANGSTALNQVNQIDSVKTNQYVVVRDTVESFSGQLPAIPESAKSKSVYIPYVPDEGLQGGLVDSFEEQHPTYDYLFDLFVDAPLTTVIAECENEEKVPVQDIERCYNIYSYVNKGKTSLVQAACDRLVEILPVKLPYAKDYYEENKTEIKDTCLEGLNIYTY